MSVTSVAPRLCVDGHAVFPFVFEQVSRLVAIGAGVVSTVGADGAVTPPIICHHCVSYWTVKEKQVDIMLTDKTMILI